MTPESPVINGLEKYEVVFGADQPEYMPLPALRSPDGRVMSRWALTPKERELVANGADVLITIHTFNRPYPPTQVEIGRADEISDFHAGRLCIAEHFELPQATATDDKASA